MRGFDPHILRLRVFNLTFYFGEVSIIGTATVWKTVLQVTEVQVRFLFSPPLQQPVFGVRDMIVNHGLRGFESHLVD